MATAAVGSMSMSPGEDQEEANVNVLCGNLLNPEHPCAAEREERILILLLRLLIGNVYDEQHIVES